MLRTTPIHLLFPDGTIDRDRFDNLRAEAEGAGQDPWNPLAVSALPSVAAWLSEVRQGGEDPHTVHAYSALVYYAMHAISSDGSFWAVDEGVGRGLAAEEVTPRDWSESAPTLAGYLQLPQNVYWVHTEAEGGEGFAEPVDGIFWANHDEGLWVMLAAGLREGRPGFSAVALDRVPSRDIGIWADADMREGGPDFETTLPGGDLAGFLTLASSGEVLKLLSRAWRHIESENAAEEPAATEGGLSFRTLASET